MVPSQDRQDREIRPKSSWAILGQFHPRLIRIVEGVTLNNRQEFDEFIMNSLSLIKEDVPEVDQRSYALLTTLAAGGSTLDEGIFSFFLKEADIPHYVILDHLAYIAGMGCFDVLCDCYIKKPWAVLDLCPIANLSSNTWYDRGVHEREVMSDMYMKVTNDIMSLRMELDL